MIMFCGTGYVKVIFVDARMAIDSPLAMDHTNCLPLMWRPSGDHMEAIWRFSVLDHHTASRRLWRCTVYPDRHQSLTGHVSKAPAASFIRRQASGSVGPVCLGERPRVNAPL